jgi:hypothetical protein
VAVYCNVLSHLEAIEELLGGGRWCDDILVTSEFSPDDDLEALFRYYGLTFLGVEECIADLRLIRGAACNSRGRMAKVEPHAEDYMGYINHVWKHRDHSGLAAEFHRMHHHGPYLFADHPHYREGLPADGTYVAMGHRTPRHITPPVPLVVPSLIGAMQALGEVVLATSRLLRSDPGARQRVRNVYGMARF